MIHRRSFITGLVSLVAAPAIVRAGSMMPVRGEVLKPDFVFEVELPVLSDGAGWRIHGLPEVKWRSLNEADYSWMLEPNELLTGMPWRSPDAIA